MTTYESRIRQFSQDRDNYEARLKQAAQENDELRRRLNDLGDVNRKLSEYENRMNQQIGRASCRERV